MPLFLEHGLVHHKCLTLCLDLTYWKWNVMVQYCIPILVSSICLTTNDQFDSQFVKRLSNTLVACFFILYLCLEFSCFKSHDCGFFPPYMLEHHWILSFKIYHWFFSSLEQTRFNSQVIGYYHDFSWYCL